MSDVNSYERIANIPNKLTVLLVVFHKSSSMVIFPRHTSQNDETLLGVLLRWQPEKCKCLLSYYVIAPPKKSLAEMDFISEDGYVLVQCVCQQDYLNNTGPILLNLGKGNKVSWHFCPFSSCPLAPRLLEKLKQVCNGWV